MLYKLLCGMDRNKFDPLVVSLARKGPLADRIAELAVWKSRGPIVAPLRFLAGPRVIRYRGHKSRSALR